MGGDDLRAQTPEAVARESLLQAVDERVRGFAESGVASLVLEESATSQVRLLEELISGAAEFDLEAYVALGSLHWCRFQARPEGEDQADLGAAYYFFTAIARIVPHGAPEPARHYLSRDGSALGFVAGWISQQAIASFREFERAGDRGALDSAVYLFGLAMDITRLTIPAAPPACPTSGTRWRSGSS